MVECRRENRGEERENGPNRKKAAVKRRRDRESPIVKKWAHIKSRNWARRRDLRGSFDLVGVVGVVVGRNERAHPPPVPLLRLPR